MVDTSAFGINSHGSARVVEIFAGIGVRWHRIDIDWNVVEPRQNDLQWAELDRMCDTAARLGVSLLGSIAYTPSWASGSPKREAPPLDPLRLASFCGRVAERYRGRIAALSVGNEPNLKQFFTGSREQYLGLLGPSLGAIRDAAPEILRCGPDLSGWSGSANGKPWLDQVLRVTDVDPQRPLLDVFTHHQYGAGDMPSGRAAEIDRVHDFMQSRDLHRRPLWITEIGWDTGKVPTETMRGAHLRGTMAAMQARASWWKKTFWYDSHGLVDGTGPARWGLLIGPESAPDFGRPLGAFYEYADVVGQGGPPPGPGSVSDASAVRLVEAAYRGVLGRPPDPEGLQAHLGLARSGDVLSLCRALFSSAELQAQSPSAEVMGRRLYEGILNREPDASGLALTIAELRAGRGPQRAVDMLQSHEYLQRTA